MWLPYYSYRLQLQSQLQLLLHQFWQLTVFGHSNLQVLTKSNWPYLNIIAFFWAGIVADVAAFIIAAVDIIAFALFWASIVEAIAYGNTNTPTTKTWTFLMRNHITNYNYSFYH